MPESATDGGDGPDCPIVPAAGPRQARQLREWTFVDDGEESAVTVPHTWNDGELAGEPEEVDRDEKRYRTTVEASSGGGRQFLHFEGANQVTTVSVDGETVGTHRGGYTAFTFDVTEHLDAGESATVEVSVDNTHDDDIPPANADFTFFGGIYRPVWLVETSDVHLDGTEYGASGVYVDTPTVAPDEATVRARVDLANRRDEAVFVDVTHRVVDGGGDGDAGETVAEFGSSVPVGADGTRSVESVSDAIDDPDLWHPDTPHLYTVETTVAVDGEVTDRVDSPLGVREVGLQDGRITINGEPTELRGTNRHQDRPDIGNALPDSAHVEDVNLIADTGANFLRLAHYPQSHTVLDTADERGLLCWEEIPVINWVVDTEAYRENCKTRLTEMVRQHYNHPSVGMWGFMNEILLGYDMEYFPDIDSPEAAHLARETGEEFDAHLREEDPSRLTAMACHGSWEYERFGLVDIPDVLGWNLYHGWYYGEVEYMDGVLFEKLAARPEQATMISEYGVGADTRLHTTEPTRWDYTEEYHSYYHEGYIAAFDEFPELAGTAQWNCFDFTSEIRADTIPGINQKGLMTHDRTPKSVYHLYRAWRSEDPVVHVATRHWDRRTTASAREDGTHPITVHSNQESVELFVDGESRGVKAPDEGYTATWDVDLALGTNEIRAVAGDDAADRDPVEDEYAVEVTAVSVDSDGAFPDDGLRIDVGSHREIVTDELWAPDHDYESSDLGWGAVGGEHVETQERILKTDLTPLYQHALVGLDAYRLDLPAGEYRVELGFCDFECEDPGERSVSVTANGETVADGVDPIADAGVRTPVSVTGDVSVEGDEGLVLEFDAEAGDTLLNALTVERV